MATLSDFSGILVALAPSATAANNAAGKVVQIQGNNFLSQGPTTVGGTTAQNDPILVFPLFATSHKIIKAAPKTAGATWTAGQTLYLIEATGIYTTASTGNSLAGIAAADAASAATTGDVLPAASF